jgi:hypothetical protein
MVHRFERPQADEIAVLFERVKEAEPRPLTNWYRRCSETEE